MKKFLGVYYELGRDARGTYSKISTEKDVKKPVEGYGKYPLVVFVQYGLART